MLEWLLGPSAIAAPPDEHGVGSQYVKAVGALASFVLPTLEPDIIIKTKKSKWPRSITPGASFSGAQGLEVNGDD